MVSRANVSDALCSLGMQRSLYQAGGEEQSRWQIRFELEA